LYSALPGIDVRTQVAVLSLMTTCMYDATDFNLLLNFIFPIICKNFISTQCRL